MVAVVRMSAVVGGWSAVVSSNTNDSEGPEHAADTPEHDSQRLRPRLSEAAAELSQDLHRSPRPSEVAERAHTDVDDVIESLGEGPIDHH